MAGATIAGTSAGAAAASNPLIYDGDDAGFTKNVTKDAEGFGFVKNITIDTHFTERNRIYRLSQFLLSGKSHRGIGIGENTAVIIAPDHTMEVIGSGMVTVINTKRTTFSNFESVNRYEPLTANGINIGFLHSGALFNLQYWKVLDYLRQEEYFSRVESHSDRWNDR
jgi:cyanophycinase